MLQKEQWFIWQGSWLPSQKSEVRIPVRAKSIFHCTSVSIQHFKCESKGRRKAMANYLIMRYAKNNQNPTPDSPMLGLSVGLYL
ncbi:hypothetical protein PoB_007563500 [Plakobranchus ocellatus]|uniref:Uncharacterized protein n=1 Tax=Plakobranchus ocellatus TaxID=259542 RepID=A0AAV4DYN6_9GAST|nr:hypothetical protein PoB_007563500 [Plakobranchus ocellatus]